MSGPIEVLSGTVCVLAVAVALLLVPLPRQKPPEIDQEAQKIDPHKVQTPQQVVAVSTPAPEPKPTEEQQLESIESKLKHIQNQVNELEQKAERLK